MKAAKPLKEQVHTDEGHEPQDGPCPQGYRAAMDEHRCAAEDGTEDSHPWVGSSKLPLNVATDL